MNIGASQKEKSGLYRVPGYATFGIVKVDSPGPWVFYLALSIIALPQKKIDRHRSCRTVAATPLFSETGGHYWDLLDFVGLTTSPLSGSIGRDFI